MKASNSYKRGFTFIELMVVITIIGALTAIIYVRGEASRSKARDGRRISEITQIQAGLEGYFGRYGQYPAALSTVATEGYMSSDLLKDPKGNFYGYSVGGDSKSYCLGTTLETSTMLPSASCTPAVPAGQAANNYKVSR